MKELLYDYGGENRDKGTNLKVDLVIFQLDFTVKSPGVNSERNE